MSKKYWIVVTALLSIVLTGLFIFVTNSSQQNDRDKNAVSWDETIRILNSGQVKQVFQTHSLDVTLILKDGTGVDTREPSIDDIFDEVKKCGEPCRDIMLVTE